MATASAAVLCLCVSRFAWGWLNFGECVPPPRRRRRCRCFRLVVVAVAIALYAYHNRFADILTLECEHQRIWRSGEHLHQTLCVNIFEMLVARTIVIVIFHTTDRAFDIFSYWWMCPRVTFVTCKSINIIIRKKCDNSIQIPTKQWNWKLPNCSQIPYSWYPSANFHLHANLNAHPDPKTISSQTTVRMSHYCPFNSP